MRSLLPSGRRLLAAAILLTAAVAGAATTAAPPLEGAPANSLTIVLEVNPLATGRFTFDDVGGADLFAGLPGGRLILDHNPATAFPSQMTIEGLSNRSTYAVTQAPVADYELTVTCSSNTGGSVFTPVEDGQSFRLGRGDAITCTFTNTDPAAQTPADTTPPVLALPNDFSVEATGATTVVAYEASATDLVDGPRAVTCDPASGAGFALGDTTVECSASDEAGNAASGSFVVTVEDTTPPVLALPSDFATEATGATTVVTFEASATDLVDGSRTVTCDPASGSGFALGGTTVDCSTSDEIGNTALGSFVVTVEDTAPPVLALPLDFSVEATGATTVVTFEATATDLDGPRAVTCDPASATGFALGDTTVDCSASDEAGNAASGSFVVTVEDTTPPVLALPSAFAAEATGPSTIVTFEATATDLVDGSRAVTCDPASGSGFALGDTTVDCSASDEVGSTASGSFVVTVEDTTPPVLALPSDFTLEATCPSTTVTFEASATDLVDGSRTVTCDPASGSGFALGDTTVDCSANDEGGNTARGSFVVTVEDTTPPVLALPGDLFVNAAHDATSAEVAFEATADDLVDGAVLVACTPASGSSFPVGTTEVRCNAADRVGNPAEGSLTVTVLDVTPPVLALPDRVASEETPAGSGSAVVTFDAPAAVDAVDGAVEVDCTRASGDVFVVGVTVVACSAEDAAGNAAGGTFEVDVVAVPWSLTVEVQVSHQQPLDIPFLVAGLAVGAFALDDPLTDDSDGVASTRRFEGTGNGVAIAIEALLPGGFELASIACDGGSAAVEASRAGLVLDAGEHVRCLFELDDIDLDDDGLTDALEAMLGTDPTLADSDGDGIDDGEELFIRGTDPLDGGDTSASPAVLPPRTFSPVPSREGASLTIYGGGTLGDLLADLEARGVATAMFTTADGRALVLVVTDLGFVIESFALAYFGADRGSGSYLDLPIRAGTLLLVRARA